MPPTTLAQDSLDVTDRQRGIVDVLQHAIGAGPIDAFEHDVACILRPGAPGGRA
jgi:hypothetical protein